MSMSPERLHVIRCYDRLPPMPGGMERHIAELTAAQRRMGVRVTELFNSGEAAGESIQLWPGWRLDKLRPGLLRFGLFYASAARRGIDLSDGRVPVLHIHGDWPAFHLARALLADRFKVGAIAASLHGTASTGLRKYANALRGYDLAFSTGLKQARDLAALLSAPVIHLPSAPADLFFEPPRGNSSTVDVIAVGSLMPVKNVELILQCAARRPNVTFAVLGDGPERERLEHVKRRLGLNNVHFRGAVSLDEVRSALGSARLFLNTSMTEGSPTAALEAMACGLPVVLTPGNDYSAIVDQGINGRVTGSWSADELVRAIDEFLYNPGLLKAAGDTARRTAKAHSWDSNARIVTEAMIAAVERRAPAAP